MPTFYTPSVIIDGQAVKVLNNSGHALIAGTTGSGKSVFLHTVLYAALSRSPLAIPGGIGLGFIDLKRVELAEYKPLPHTLAYADDVPAAVDLLRRFSATMENRYKQMQKEGAKTFNGSDLYLIVDELADLIHSDVRHVLPELEHIGRLGRAARVHMILCTQSPDRKTLCATVQQNITLAYALRCRSAIESRQIIGRPGAETLPLYGKAIRWSPEGYAFCDIRLTPDEQTADLIAFWRRQGKDLKPWQKRA